MRNPLSPSARAGVAALCLTIAAAAAHAQFGGGMGRMGHGQRDGADATTGGTAAAPQPSLPDRLYQARMRLLIDKDQSAAWERFYAAATSLDRLPSFDTPDPSLTAPQAMQLALSAAQDRHARTEELTDALKALYAQLDEKQRRTADEVLPPLLISRQPGLRAAGAGRTFERR